MGKANEGIVGGIEGGMEGWREGKAVFFNVIYF